MKQVSLERIDDNFMKMKALDNEHISFIMINPFSLRDYDFEVPQNIQDLLEVDKDSNLIILNIVLIQTPVEDSVVNFIGPVVFNTDKNKAAKVIINDSKEYTVADKISDFLKK